ncbi:endonuclease [Actinoplanes sp. DH11]|uniref:endonuclease n=1 Tax=Actinoplanes sp. DH11 TaxID=2857011 RepID=UPI001E64172D|nr:endonuclease [Actinoplanes sp. DH11]
MPGPTRHRRLLVLPTAALASLLALLISLVTPPASAAATLTVAQAINGQGGTGTVTGYVVGQPTTATTVLFGGFTGDTALAIADSRTETNTNDMLYVQVSSPYRASFGLLTNPGLVGRAITVTGTLSAYFSHAGLKSPTAMNAGPTGGPTATPDSYYAAATGKSGAALKNALHTIISTGVTKLSYDAVWNALKVTDQDPSNAANVRLLYSGISRSKSLNGGAGGNWNREHVWAQSHGDIGTSAGPGTDLHHLRAEDVTVNATRGNKDFDNGGSAVAGAAGNYTDADSWEPRSAVKDDVARMIFYMAVRYQGTDGFADLEVNDAVNNGSRPYLGRLSVLKQWHAADPPDAAERNRNQVIYTSYQRNRNPFIDHPEWVPAVFG